MSLVGLATRTVERAALALTPVGRIVAGLQWLGDHWREILVAIGFAGLGLLYLGAEADSRHWEKQSDRFEGLYHAEVQAHAVTILEVRRRTAEAKAADEAHARAVERAQANISSEVSHDYQAKLGALRARYDALRLRAPGAGGAAANPGGGGGTGLPAPADPAGRADDPAGEEGFSLDDRFTCSAQAEQLDALITWVGRETGP
jgi:hypothetical protein